MHAYNVNQNNYDFLYGEFDEFDTATVRVKPESLDNLVKMTKFSRRELKWMYRGFKQSCPAGVVKEDKFKLIYAQFFPRGAETALYAKYLFQSFDSSSKAEITFTEFVINLSKLMHGSMEAKLRWIFSLYDLNSDGYITRDELQKIVIAIYELVGRYAVCSPSLLPDTDEQCKLAMNETQQICPDSDTQQHLNVPTTTTTTTTASQQQLAKLQLNQMPSIDQLEILFQKFDLNGDGYITIDEFIEACMKDDNIVNSISVFETIF